MLCKCSWAASQPPGSCEQQKHYCSGALQGLQPGTSPWTHARHTYSSSPSWKFHHPVPLFTSDLRTSTLTLFLPFAFHPPTLLFSPFPTQFVPSIHPKSIPKSAYILQELIRVVISALQHIDSTETPPCSFEYFAARKPQSSTFIFLLNRLRALDCSAYSREEYTIAL